MFKKFISGYVDRYITLLARRVSAVLERDGNAVIQDYYILKQQIRELNESVDATILNIENKHKHQCEVLDSYSKNTIEQITDYAKKLRAENKALRELVDKYEKLLLNPWEPK